MVNVLLCILVVLNLLTGGNIGMCEIPKVESNNSLCITVDNGKYTVMQEKFGNLKALRYGEEWRDCCGDNLIYALACEIESLREIIEDYKAETEEKIELRSFSGVEI